MRKNIMFKIGVGVIIENGDQILLGKRIGKHGHATWSFPGGHLEENETPIDCGIRETLEETGLKINDITSHHWTYDLFEESGKRYITLFIKAKYAGGEPQVLEPDKCECWQWYAWDNLPSPLFKPIENLLKRTLKNSCE